MAAGTMAILSTLGALLLVGADGPGRGLVERETVERTLRFEGAGAGRTVRVDDVFGSIDVVGAAVDDVQVSGEKVLRAETADAMARARREVRLEMSAAGDAATIVVDGPFRREDGSINWDWDARGYVVKYDLELRVPEGADLVLKTVNEGDVAVRGVAGRLRVRNVNGAITLERVAGPVDASTVNGAIHATFRRDPSSACRFHTVNGDLQVAFGAALGADFAVKTFNGEVRTDYDVVSLPAEPGEARRENGRFVYRSSGFQRVRVGKGGPEITMETLNGDIVIANGK
jgi:hypothetical protein